MRRVSGHNWLLLQIKIFPNALISFEKHKLTVCHLLNNPKCLSNEMERENSIFMFKKYKLSKREVYCGRVCVGNLHLFSQEMQCNKSREKDNSPFRIQDEFAKFFD